MRACIVGPLAGRTIRWVWALQVVSYSRNASLQLEGRFEGPCALKRIGRCVPIAHRVHLTPPYEQTIAEPLGSFDACLRLRAPTDVSELSASITGAFAVPSTTPLFGHVKNHKGGFGCTPRDPLGP